MIVVVLKDGSRRTLDKAKVTLEWTIDDAGTVETFTLDEVKALMVMDPEVGTMLGDIGGMPVLGMRFTDTSDLRIEIPIPVGDAATLGNQLVEMVTAAQSKVHRVGLMPSTLPPPPGA